MNKLETEEYIQPQVEPRGDNQIAESRGTIEAFKKNITNEITKIRLDTDMMENERRIKEERESDQR